MDQKKFSSIRKELQLGQTVNVIMISRLVVNKGVKEFLCSARKIVAENSNVRFFLVGPRGTEGSQAVSKVLLDEYSDVVTWLGERSDIRELLSLSHIFVLPSYYREGVPRVLLEAGALGLPLITTNMPGCKEVVVDGWNGFLVNPRSVESLIEKLHQLLALEDQGKSMGLRNKKYIKENFDLTIVVQSYIDVYKNILA